LLYRNWPHSKPFNSQAAVDPALSLHTLFFAIDEARAKEKGENASSLAYPAMAT
jgi:hypothetical protein